jgi:hypothetical protein
MQRRAADIEAGIRMVAMNAEIVLVGAADRHRIERGGVHADASALVEHLDRAEMIGGRGMIEQDQMQQRFGNVLEFGHHHVADDRAQRQVVDLDVAADIGIDAGGDVFKGLPGERLFAAPHVQHDVGADR